MEQRLDQLQRIVGAMLRGEKSVDSAAAEIVNLGLGPNFAVGGDVLDDPTSLDARRLQELLWKVARLHHSQSNR